MTSLLFRVNKKKDNEMLKPSWRILWFSFLVGLQVMVITAVLETTNEKCQTVTVTSSKYYFKKQLAL